MNATSSDCFPLLRFQFWKPSAWRSTIHAAYSTAAYMYYPPAIQSGRNFFYCNSVVLVLNRWEKKNPRERLPCFLNNFRGVKGNQKFWNWKTEYCIFTMNSSNWNELLKWRSLLMRGSSPLDTGRDRKFCTHWWKFLAYRAEVGKKGKRNGREGRGHKNYLREVLMYTCALVLLVHMYNSYCYWITFFFFNRQSTGYVCNFFFF